ncbi:hypothetical protein WN51_06585 [Melipona quadrifasciata]|uniref:Uncharacterized protein n=1 Tax=Melipona quadrifasciata TaxID=166423 RepID=A0A0M8ZT99_9HYME|nr:hypothetical protein WN51_06585 [Melipona quadrifasciata]
MAKRTAAGKEEKREGVGYVRGRKRHAIKREHSVVSLPVSRQQTTGEGLTSGGKYSASSTDKLLSCGLIPPSVARIAVSSGGFFSLRSPYPLFRFGPLSWRDRILPDTAKPIYLIGRGNGDKIFQKLHKNQNGAHGYYREEELRNQESLGWNACTCMVARIHGSNKANEWFACTMLE